MKERDHVALPDWRPMPELDMLAHAEAIVWETRRRRTMPSERTGRAAALTPSQVKKPFDEIAAHQ